MYMMKKKAITLLALTAMLLTACCDDGHKKPGDQPVGYITPLLTWEEETDDATTIDALHFVVNGTTGGTGVTHDFSTTASAAEWLQLLPVGSYDLLVTANMDKSHGYVMENDATRAGEDFATALPDTRVSLADPSSSPAQAWYAVTHATVKEDEITVAEFSLQRLLSEISVSVSNVPAGTTVTASVERVARSVLLTHRDGQGRYGVADRDDYLAVTLGALAPEPAPDGSPVGTATLRHDDHTLMPTAGGQERCYLTLTVTPSSGTPLTYLADAPRMECGKAYVVELDYTKLRPYMLLSAFTINDWTEGWTISGEILNPTNK